MNSRPHLHHLSSETIPFHTTSLNVEDLLSHTLVVGESGSGKSRGVIRPLLRELLSLHAPDEARKAGLFCIDGKGELRHYLEEALALAGRTDDLVVVSPREATINPFSIGQWSDGRLASALMEAINTVGGPMIRRSLDPFWENAARDLLTALVAVARHGLHGEGKSPCPLHAGHLARLRPMLSKSDADIAHTTADLAAVLGEEAGTALVEFAALPANTRHSVATEVGTILGAFS